MLGSLHIRQAKRDVGGKLMDILLTAAPAEAFSAMGRLMHPLVIGELAPPVCLF